MNTDGGVVHNSFLETTMNEQQCLNLQSRFAGTFPYPELGAIVPSPASLPYQKNDQKLIYMFYKFIRVYPHLTLSIKSMQNILHYVGALFVDIDYRGFYSFLADFVKSLI